MPIPAVLEALNHNETTALDIMQSDMNVLMNSNRVLLTNQIDPDINGLFVDGVYVGDATFEKMSDHRESKMVTRHTFIPDMKGGVTWVFRFSDDMVFFAFAVCSKKDTYNRKLGRKLAEQRLFDNPMNFFNVSLLHGDNLTSLAYDVLSNQVDRERLDTGVFDKRDIRSLAMRAADIVFIWA